MAFLILSDANTETWFRNVMRTRHSWWNISFCDQARMGN